MGTLDDLVQLRGRQKLLGQVLAAFVLIAGGLVIRKVGLFGWQIDLGLLSVPITIFWLLWAINSINLLDGIDGLAGTVGLILTATIGVMAVMVNHFEVALVAMVFAGSLVGFLFLNWPPARIFLGDAGSMLIGLVVGTLAIQSSLKGPGTVLLAAPLAVWAIPTFDVLAAILRRKLTGRSIYATDRAHLHHQLLARLGNGQKVVVWLATSCALTSAAALASVFLQNDSVALVACAGLIAVFVVTGVFGRTEFLLLLDFLRRITRSLLPRASSNGSAVSEASFHLQGSGQWHLLWESLTEAAEKLHLSRVRLNVNLPAQGEGYSARWDRDLTDDLERCWCMDFPLMHSGTSVGRLTVFGNRNGGLACQDIECLITILEPFETQLLQCASAELPDKNDAPQGRARRSRDRQPEAHVNRVR